MARGPARFRQRDVERVLRAMRSTGVQVARVEVTADGKIIVIAGQATKAEDTNEWDTDLDAHQA
jgi:hypothetical protein